MDATTVYQNKKNAESNLQYWVQQGVTGSTIGTSLIASVAGGAASLTKKRKKGKYNRKGSRVPQHENNKNVCIM
jgi:hypothetical protein